MASPGQRRGTCGHAMALFDTHTKCARCRDKGLGPNMFFERKTVICNSFTEDQKLQLATPTYRARKDKELQKKIASPFLVDPSTVTVVGKVENGKGDSIDRGKTPTKKKKASHKSPKKYSTPPKNPEFQSDLKKLDDKWAEHFISLEALFLSKTFQLLVEPVQSSNVVVSEKPFLPPAQQSTSQKPATSVTGKKKAAIQPVEAPGVKKVATQPAEAPGVTLATRPVEAPSAGTEIHPTSQAAVSPSGALPSDRLEVPLPSLPLLLISQKILLQKMTSLLITLTSV